MRRILRAAVLILAALVLLALVGPFLIPVPPLQGTVAEQYLADPDSRFITVNGVRVHYKQAGTGQPVFVLLHGFGASVSPGARSWLRWRRIRAGV